MVTKKIIISTTNEIAGKKVSETLGVARGNIVRAKHVGRDILAGLKQIVGGEIKGYTDMITESRDEATERMLEEAKSMGADAVVGVRFTTSSVMPGAAEILAYGTAVKLK